MPAKAPRRPATRAQLVSNDVADAATSRALDAVGRSVAQLEGQGRRWSGTADLSIGANRVNHGLGRVPRGAVVSPTVADATFAWAMTSADEKQVVLSVIGAAQPGAGIEVF